jgi:RimJ/RimL family protein N-acetyltransferase
MVKNFDREFKLVRAKQKDVRFVYDVVKNWLDKYPDHSVTTLRIPSFVKFSKTKTTKYIIKRGNTSIGFVHILTNNEIGYYIVPQFQGIGIGTWAVAQLMKKQPRDRYFATVNNKNTASMKLITSLGFKPKATIYEKIVKPTRKISNN